MEAWMQTNSLPYVAEAVRRGQCVLFLGAGVHAVPPVAHASFSEAERPATGAELSRKLGQDSDFRQTFPGESEEHLQRVALHYEVRRSRRQLIDRVRREVSENKAPSPLLRALAELDFPIVMTTNYDCLFEKALQDKGKQPVCGVYSPRETVPTRDLEGPEPNSVRPFISKIHGDISDPESIVITDED